MYTVVFFPINSKVSGRLREMKANPRNTPEHIAKGDVLIAALKERRPNESFNVRRGSENVEYTTLEMMQAMYNLGLVK